MRTILLVFGIFICAWQNVYSGDFTNKDCTNYQYGSISVCLSSDYTVDNQDNYISISKKSLSNKGFVVIGSSPGNSYEKSVADTCNNNNKISCLSNGECSISNAKGKRLKYVDNDDVEGIINNSCFIEQAHLVIIFHGYPEGEILLDEILSNAALQ